MKRLKKEDWTLDWVDDRMVGMKTIPLTKGYFAIIDDCDFESVSEFSWCASGISVRPYAYNDFAGFMHRFIMNAPLKLDVDHIDHNTLNNTRKNLRLCTRSQNLANRRGLQSNNTSNYTGVCWDKKKLKYITYINCKNKRIYLGLFDDPEEAAKERDKKALELFGEFATLNFPNEQYQT